MVIMIMNMTAMMITLGIFCRSHLTCIKVPTLESWTKSSKLNNWPLETRKSSNSNIWQLKPVLIQFCLTLYFPCKMQAKNHKKSTMELPGGWMKNPIKTKNKNITNVCVHWNWNINKTQHKRSYPAGALRRRLLHRNGNFVPPAQWIQTRQQDFR